MPPCLTLLRRPKLKRARQPGYLVIGRYLDLLQGDGTIPGIGDLTAALFMAEVPGVTRFRQAGQLAAYAGLTPGQKQSGTSIHKPARLVKWGNSYLRCGFFMPALSAFRFNPIIADLRERLLQRGKSKMTVVVACMRKLLHLAYGVLKTRLPFDPNHTVNMQPV